jgi:hypothetical protein
MAKGKLVDTWYYDVEDLIVVDGRPRDPNDALKAQARADREGRAVEEDEEDETPDPARQRVITKKVEIQVRMEKDTIDTGGPPYALKEVIFTVSCDDPKFEYEGTDIALLKDAAWEFLTNNFKIKWENYYLVSVNHANDYGGYSTGLTFGYKDVEKGTTWNGKELLREWTFGGKREIKPWPGRFTDKGGRAVACIPQSKENTAALKEFAKRVDKLRELIRDTIKPEVIMQTLQNLSGMSLLPAPDPDDEKEKDDES